MAGIRRGRPNGCLVAIGMVVAVIAAGLLIPKLFEWWERTDPAARAPSNLGAAIGTELLERAVPDAVPSARETYSSGPDAACAYRDGDGPPAQADAYGYLEVRMLRYGRVAFHSPANRAAAGFDSSCGNTSIAGKRGTRTGLGEEACVASSDEGDEGTATVSAIVRRGADVIWVDCYRHPGHSAELLDRVDEIVRATLANVP